MTPIVWMEIYKGIRAGEERKVLTFLNFFECLDVDKEVGIIAGDLLREFSRSHGLEETDALAAALAICNKCLLFTCNRKHFNMIEVNLFK